MIPTYVTGRVIAMFLFAALSAMGFASPAAAAPRQSLAQFIEAEAKDKGLDGTILVSRGDKLLFRRSYGLANRAFAVPAQPTDRYLIASITKLFTATLVLQLADEKKLSLDDTVASILGSDSITAADRISLRQLLNHTSGIRQFDRTASLDEALRTGVPQYQRPRDAAGLLESCCRMPLERQPGQAFDYNNADYFVLEKVIEKVTGRTYAEAIEERIARPLGLKTTGMADQSAIVPRLVPTYYFIADQNRWINDLPMYFQNWGAAGGMMSSADDLRRFADALYGGRLLSENGLRELLAPGLDEYGLGLWSYSFERDGRTWRIAKRPGSIMGVNTQLYRLIDPGLTIIVLANTNRADLDRMVQRIADAWIARQ